MDKKDLRSLVLETLRQGPHTSFHSIEHAVAKLDPKYDSRGDVLTIREIIWELLTQGIFAPGSNASNLCFPHIHLTAYGERCLAADAILPHDPDRYVEQLRDRICQQLDQVVLIYVQESLQTFLTGNYLAATVMLGVASERLIDLLAEAFLQSLTDPNRKTKLEKKFEGAGRSVKQRFDLLRKELAMLPLPHDLKDALDIHLSSIFTLIRYGRNNAGHPTGRMVGRDTAHGNLLLFPQYCERVYGLIDHFRLGTGKEGCKNGHE